MGTSSDTLSENEWLVRDGAANVLFCALAWTLAQWAGSGRIKVADPPQPAFTECERLFNLLKSTISPASHGFKGFGIVGNADSTDDQLDCRGIRAVIPRMRLSGLEPTDNVAMLKAMHEGLLASLVPTGGCPRIRLDHLLEGTLVYSTYAKICGYSNSVLSGTKTWRGRVKAASIDGTSHVWQPTNLSQEFHSAAPLARVLIGSTSSIERTTLALYQAGISLDTFQNVAAEADAASPIPRSVLIRLARIFGFSPVSDDQASVEVVAEARTQMTEARRNVWDAWCGEIKDEDTLRGAGRSDFATCFIAALEKGELGPLIGDVVKVASPKQVDRGSKAKNLQADVVTAPASIPPRPDAGIVINALSADFDRIEMTIDLKLDDGRIALRSMRYQLDTEVDDAAADVRLCLRRIVTRWDWGQSIRAQLEDADETTLLRSIISANPGLKIDRVVTGTANLRFSVGPDQTGEALAPSPNVAIERLVLPRAELAADETSTHRFELWAYWSDVRFRQRESDGTFRLFDRAALREPLTEAESGRLALREYAAQIELSFPTDGQLHQLGFREARVQRQPSASA